MMDTMEFLSWTSLICAINKLNNWGHVGASYWYICQHFDWWHSDSLIPQWQRLYWNHKTANTTWIYMTTLARPEGPSRVLILLLPASLVTENRSTGACTRLSPDTDSWGLAARLVTYQKKKHGGEVSGEQVTGCWLLYRLHRVGIKLS